MTTILLIRHADNDFVGKRLAGRLPKIHLNEHGQEQARNLAKHLAHLPILRIFCSPLERTYETAMPLSKALNIPIIRNLEFNEIDYGDWQGEVIDNLTELPEWKELMNNAIGFTFPGGESLINAQKRSVTELLKIKETSSEESIEVCITHGDIVRLSLSHFLNMSLNDYHRLVIDTASISTIKFNQDGLLVSGMNIKPFGKFTL